MHRAHYRLQIPYLFLLLSLIVSARHQIFRNSIFYNCISTAQLVQVDGTKLCVKLHIPHTTLPYFNIEITIIIACAGQVENLDLFFGGEKLSGYFSTTDYVCYNVWIACICRKAYALYATNFIWCCDLYSSCGKFWKNCQQKFDLQMSYRDLPRKINSSKQYNNKAQHV